jgi:hypothetical protein
LDHEVLVSACVRKEVNETWRLEKQVDELIDIGSEIYEENLQFTQSKDF